MKSVMKYEKASRVAQEAMRLSLHMRRYATGLLKPKSFVLTGAIRLPELAGVHYR